MRHLRNPFVQVGLWTLAITAVVAVIVLTRAVAAGGGLDRRPARSTRSTTCWRWSRPTSSRSSSSILLVAVVHFRAPPQRPAATASRSTATPASRSIWTAIPALLMVGTAVYSGLVLADIEETEGEHAGRSHVTGAAVRLDLRVPAAEAAGRASCTSSRTRRTYFKLNAKDVIHSFWVPQFRMKKDAVPGLTTEVRVTPDTHGPLHARLHRAVRARATRRCGRRSWSRTRPRSTTGRPAPEERRTCVGRHLADGE